MASSEPDQREEGKIPAGLLTTPPECIALVVRFMRCVDRGRFAQACKYTAEIAKTHHVFSDIPAEFESGCEDKELLMRAVENRQQSIVIKGHAGRAKKTLVALAKVAQGTNYKVWVQL